MTVSKPGPLGDRLPSVGQDGEVDPKHTLVLSGQHKSSSLRALTHASAQVERTIDSISIFNGTWFLPVPPLRHALAVFLVIPDTVSVGSRG